MTARFWKDWALPLALGGGVGGYLLFAKTPALAGASAALGPWCAKALPACLFLTLLATFSRVDYRRLRPRGWHWAVLGAQAAATSALAAAAWASGGGRKAVLEAALACVIAPCATAMPVVAAKLGGDLAQTTAFTLMSSLAAALAIPAVFPLLEPGSGATFWGTAGAILGRLSGVLLLPLALGAVIRHGWGAGRRWFEAHPDLGFRFWCASLALTAGLTAKNVLRGGADGWTLAAIAGVSAAAAAGQFAAGRVVGRRFGEPVCAGQGMFQKNTGLAIWITSVYLSPAASIGAGCYVLWQNLVNAWQLRRAPERAG